MKFLLNHDYCLELLKSENLRVLEQLKVQQGEAWILSASLPMLYSQLSGQTTTKKIMGQFLNQVHSLTLTAKEMKNGLAESKTGYLESLAAVAVKQYGMKGVITLQPDQFNGTDIWALPPEEALKFLEAEKGKADRVPLLNIPATFSQIMEEVEQGMAEVVRSGYFIMGPKVTELEEKVASYCQSKYAVAVSSGTDALLIALMAADIGPGDEVITTPYTFFATAGSIARTGAKPVMVDIEPANFNIDVTRIEAAITPNTKAILPVHLYGQCADMDPILEIARKHKLVVIEDAAQAIGSEYKGRRAGSIGDYGCFSFFPTKNLGGFGDGGLVTTSSKELYEKLKILRVHGMEPKYYHQLLGGNFRMDALQAAVVTAKLQFLEDWTQKRRDHAKLYNREFQSNQLVPPLSLPPETFQRHIYNQYVIRVGEGKRDALRQYLADHNIAAEIYYPVSLHEQACFQYLGYKKGDFPVAEQASVETLALPIANEITQEQQALVVNCVKDFFSR